MFIGLCDLLRLIGGGICHQRLELTFFADGIYMPVCSRCTGIYIGFIISALFILVAERKIKAKAPSLKDLVLVLTAFFIMGLDVVLTTYSLLEPNNYIRVFTGFLAGWATALVLIQLFNLVVFKKVVKQPYLNKKVKYVSWLVACIACLSIFLLSYDKFLVGWSLISVLGSLFFYTILILILLFSSIKKISNRINSIGMSILIVLAGLLIIASIISAFSLIRSTFT